MLSERYLDGIPPGSRARENDSFPQRFLSRANLDRVRGLADLARARGQTLPQMAIAWVLREPRVTSALVGVSSVEQLEADIAALDNLSFSAADLDAIDRFAVDAGIDLWEESHRFRSGPRRVTARRPGRPLAGPAAGHPAPARRAAICCSASASTFTTAAPNRTSHGCDRRPASAPATSSRTAAP